MAFRIPRAGLIPGRRRACSKWCSIRRGHVNDSHPPIVQQFVQVAVDTGNSQPPGRAFGSLGRRPQQADHLHPDSPQRLDVDRADEASADHGGRRASDDTR